ncbi:L-aspartate oxidase [Achromobacter pestifer]|uniref:L-aspartate oxidase n=1 Tax=Achromobacter pestifer TaxID=1353889 RepID=A0A7D4E2X4_9BURK|nr:L-aspartate oxidase [Achromobacter pestifer]QKH37889.1 L-aspartate oxidase [Achromobacter pestifer]
MEFDVIIIGSGLAGMAAALELAPRRRVALVSKGALRDSASNRAQGGIAAPLGAQDSVEAHVNDTLVAGAGLCDLPATRGIISRACGAIAWLQEQGVAFTPERDGLHLTREGGHGLRRIAHAADATGSAIIAALEDRVRRQPGITLLEAHCAVDLILDGTAGTAGTRCRGVRLLDLRRGRIFDAAAGHVVLATGGAGQAYQTTTAPPAATGDGIAMAWRAGCRIANMEFTQFHPTGLHHAQAAGFLISEAVRGEGGVLRLPGGARFMPAHDARAELAPRDIVARAIQGEMERHGLACVQLDISHQPPEFLREHFPTIHARCLALGIDITKASIPVSPSAHYTCGGIVADLAGRSDLSGLYAVGEAACTGLHGANRLASNSLLECVVTGRAAAQDILEQKPEDVPGRRRAADEIALPASPDLAWLRRDLRQLMSRDVGVLRSDTSLARAAAFIGPLRAQIEARLLREGPSLELLELRNLAVVADLIVRAASARGESRGAHFNRDRPGSDAVDLRLRAPAAPA